MVNLFELNCTFLYCVNVALQLISQCITSMLLERSSWKKLVWQVPHTNVIFITVGVECEVKYFSAVECKCCWLVFQEYIVIWTVETERKHIPNT